jgi:hypothetical protein
MFALFSRMSTLSQTKGNSPGLIQGIDTSLTAQMFDLMAELLKDNLVNQSDLVECGGFKVLGYVLADLSPRVFAKQTISALSNIASCIKGNGELISVLFPFSWY